MSERQKLLERLEKLCYNSEDVLTLEMWKDMPTKQLRSVVDILTNAEVEMVTSMKEGDQQKGHCFLIENLIDIISRNHSNPKHPITRGKLDLFRIIWTYNGWVKATNPSYTNTDAGLHVLSRVVDGIITDVYSKVGNREQTEDVIVDVEQAFDKSEWARLALLNFKQQLLIDKVELGKNTLPSANKSSCSIM